MNSKRLFFALIAVTILLCGGLIGGAYIANTKIKQYSLQISKKRSQVTVLQQQQDTLAKAKKDIVKYKSLANTAKNIVPQDKNQAQTIQEIVNIAAANGIRLGSITFPSSSLGETKAVGTGATAIQIPASNAVLSQLVPVPQISGVYSLQIIVTSDTESPVSYNRFTSFLNDLEHNRRTALVTNITINPDEDNRNNLTFTLTLDEYIKP